MVAFVCLAGCGSSVDALEHTITSCELQNGMPVAAVKAPNNDALVIKDASTVVVFTIDGQPDSGMGLVNIYDLEPGETREVLTKTIDLAPQGASQVTCDFPEGF